MLRHGGDMADNGVECSVVMEKTRFDTRETFPDFKLVFTNKGEKDRAPVRRLLSPEGS